VATYYWHDHYGRRWTVCRCLQKWLPAYESELLRRGLIRECIDLYQTIGNASASAKTHSTGGCADLKQTTTDQLRVARNMGAAAWRRDADPNDGQPNMSPTHTHLSLKGCPHAHSSAKAQVVSCEKGHNGLAGNGRDDGPRDGVQLPLRTWEQGITWAKGHSVPEVKDPIQWALWKITLPIGKRGKPDEHYPPTTAYRPWYGRDVTDRNWLLFRAPVDGVTTSGSSYPRSELREMTAKGAKAAWSSRKGWHNLSGAAEIRRVPGRKPSVVIAQIHDADDDVVMIRLDGTDLYLYESLGKGKGAKKHKLLAAYRLGATLTYSISAAAGGIRVVVNGNKVDIPGRLIDGGYFKAGCYSQANESNGTGYAEVAHRNVKVRHI
jgi:hypothetical protein